MKLTNKCCGGVRLDIVARQVIEGYLKKSGLIPSNKILAEQRLKVCYGCENMASNNSCNLCGCDLMAKVLVDDTKCPINKW